MDSTTFNSTTFNNEDHWFNTIDEKAIAMQKQANEFSVVVNSEFNEVAIYAIPQEDSVEVSRRYMVECKRRHEEYIHSPEYKKRQKEAEKKQREHDAALKDALENAPNEMSFRNKDTWDSRLQANEDGYGRAVYTYAERWARLMEAEINNGNDISSCAKRLSYLADEEGITGFMYGCAVSILAECWKYGESLRRWYNLDCQIGNEGEDANASGGVLNPAVLTIK